MLVPSLRGITKSAGPYPGFHSVATQQYAPVMGRREFDPEEEKEIEAGKRRWFPKIFKSYSTPASQLLSSPGKGALMAAVPGAAIGAGLGAMAGGALQPVTEQIYGGSPSRPGDGKRMAYGAAVGGLGLGGLMALLAYYKRKQRNENVEELMGRLPPHATRRDILSDPAYQKDREMAQSRRTNAAMVAAMARR